MASQVYNEFKRASMAGEVDLNADDIRVALVMSDTTIDTENDAIVFIADFATLDRANAAGYADVALTGEAVNKDDTNDRAEFDANDVSFTGLGGDASRDYVGLLVHKFVTDDTDSVVIAFVEFSAPVSGTVTQLDVTFNAEGILQLA